MLWFLFPYLVAFPFGQLASFQLFTSARIHLVDIFAAIFVLAWFADLLWTRKRENAPFSRPLLSFLGVALFSLVLGAYFQEPKAILIGTLYFLRLSLYVFFFLAVYHTIIQEKNRELIKVTLHNSLIVVGAFIALMGLIGYFLYPDTKMLSEYGWDNHYYRLVGPFLDPAFTGILLVLSLIALWFKDWKSPGSQALAVLIFLLDWSAIALTYSRASFVAAAAFFITFFVLKKNLLVLIGASLLFVATYYLLPHPYQSAGTNLGRTSTINSRFANYSGAVNSGLNTPLFGVGYNLYKPKVQNEEKITHSGSGIHSSLLFVLVTTGALGLITYLAFWWRVIEHAWWGREGKYSGILLCSAAALLAHSLFDNSLFYPWVLGWLAILLAMQ